MVSLYVSIFVFLSQEPEVFGHLVDPVSEGTGDDTGCVSSPEFGVTGDPRPLRDPLTSPVGPEDLPRRGVQTEHLPVGHS